MAPLMAKIIILQWSDFSSCQIQVTPQEKSAQWKDLEASLADRGSAVNDAETALLKAK